MWYNGGDCGACAHTAHGPGAPELSVSARLSFLCDSRLVRKSASPALQLPSHSDLELRTQPVFGKKQSVRLNTNLSGKDRRDCMTPS